MANHGTTSINLSKITRSLPAHEHASRASRQQIAGLPRRAAPPRPVFDPSTARFGNKFSDLELSKRCLEGN